MKTSYGHLTYCSNIHPGESWEDHFLELKQQVPLIKRAVSPDQPFGLGLRLADRASKTLEQPAYMEDFKNWLNENDLYVFTMNGFPYGNFHHTAVKDQVHAPDWLTQERVDYTIRLATVLAQLLPAGMEGSISTSPLTYRFWHREADREAVAQKATRNLLQVVDALIELEKETGKVLHIDIEPEPDGLLDNGREFLQWYTAQLLPLGIDYLKNVRQLDEHGAEKCIKKHIRLCYDICHFAVGYEDHAAMIEKMAALGIQTGKIQISAALKGRPEQTPLSKEKWQQAFAPFNEPVYLHQVVAMKKEGSFLRYRDMSEALADKESGDVEEWRAHYHVPIFIEQYDILQSTQADICNVLTLQKANPFSRYLEVETYTWEVLPAAMRLPIDQSVSRELQWVIDLLNNA